MINVSNEFKELMESSSDFRPHADITFDDGREIPLTTPDLSVTGNTIADASGNAGIPLGVAICRTIQLEILNPDEKFKEYDFYGAEIHLYMTFQLSETNEVIECGRFSVTSPEDYGTTIVVTAFDMMYRSDKPYSTSLTFPATAGAVLRDLCTTYKIPLATSVFKNDDFMIGTAPTGDYTARQIIGYIAMIACGNARINRNGYLEIISYDLNFSKGYHVLKKWKDITIGSDDINVTAIRTTAVGEDGEDIVYSAYGRAIVITDDGKTVLTDDGKIVVMSTSSRDETYILSVSNPLVVGHEQEFINSIAGAIAGIPFRKFSGEHICYPLAEFMDLVEVYDWRGNAYRSFITDLNFTFFGFTSMSNSAESGIQSGSTYPSPSVEAIIEARKLVAKEKNDRELAQKQLENQLSNNTGMYTTEVPQEGGGVIRYVHDKPTLAESQSVIKYAADSIGLSTDGGNTYPYGFMINGDTITRYLYAVGINADHITTGAFTVRDSSNRIIFSADKDTKKTTIADWEVGYGYMRNKDSSGRYVGTGNSGISQAFYAGGTKADGSDGVFRVNHSGQLVATNAVISGKITGETIDIRANKQTESMGNWKALFTATAEHGLFLGYEQGNYGGSIEMADGNIVISDDNGVAITSPQAISISGFDVSITADNGLNIMGNEVISGTLTCNKDMYMDGWIRCTGTQGIYWQAYGGGWYMEDSTWIKAWGNKAIYTTGGISVGRVFVNTGGATAYLDLGNKGALMYVQNGDGNIYFRYRKSASSEYSYANIKSIVSSYLPLTGDEMLGNINFSNGKGIYNITDGGYLIRDNGTLTGVGNTVRKTGVWSSDGELRWKDTTTIFTKSGSSDRRVKQDIKNLSDNYESFYMSIIPYSFRYRIDGDDRTHIGYMAQDVAASAESYGLPDDISLWEGTEPMGDALQYVETQDKLLRINYLEWVPLNTYMVQKLYKKFEMLERRLDEKNI